MGIVSECSIGNHRTAFMSVCAAGYCNCIKLCYRSIV
jgi:hypothetical protein